MDNIIEFIIVLFIIIVFIIGLGFLFHKLVHINNRCYGYAIVKDLEAVDRGNYVYTTQDGKRFSTYYQLYQNGDRVCISGQSDISIGWR